MTVAAIPTTWTVPTSPLKQEPDARLGLLVADTAVTTSWPIDARTKTRAGLDAPVATHLVFAKSSHRVLAAALLAGPDDAEVSAKGAGSWIHENAEVRHG
jgi:hypothetical protein